MSYQSLAREKSSSLVLLQIFLGFYLGSTSHLFYELERWFWMTYTGTAAIAMLFGLFSKRFIIWRLAFIYTAGAFLLWSLLQLNSSRFEIHSWLTNFSLAITLFLMAVAADDPRALSRLQAAWKREFTELAPQ